MKTKGGLCKTPSNTNSKVLLKQKYAIKMYDNYSYSLVSVKQKITQIITDCNQIITDCKQIITDCKQTNTKYSDKIINDLWSNENIVLLTKETVSTKQIHIKPNPKSKSNSHSHSNSNSNHTKTSFNNICGGAQDLKTKEMILRLFYKNLNDVSPEKNLFFTDDCLQSTTGGNLRYAYKTEIVSRDERRVIVAFIILNLDEPDEHYILKLTSNDEYKTAYKYEAKIYNRLLTDNNIVQYFDFGFFVQERMSSSSHPNTTITRGVAGNTLFDPNDWSLIKSESMQNDGVYILLENAMADNYMTFRQYITSQLITHENTSTNQVEQPFYTNVKTMLMKVYESHESLYGKKFFHGDLHTNNVLVKEDYSVKLFDFDFGGILDGSPIISPNIAKYNLMFNNTPVFTKQDNGKWTVDEGLSNKPIYNFMVHFDRFRLWLHVCDTIEFKDQIDEFNQQLDTFIGKAIYLNWLKEISTLEWHSYFDNNYFYSNIFSKLHLQTGGFVTKNFKRMGKHTVNINGKSTLRTVWSYRRQCFIKRKNGQYEKISKKQIG